MRSSDPISIPLPFEDWPAADRQAWEVAITPASLFGNGGTAAHWAAVTLRGYRAAYGRWLRFLISQDWLDVQAPFASRARPDRVAAYVESLESRVSPLSVWSYLSNLHNIHYRLAPDHDWSRPRDIVNRLHLRVGSRHIAPGRLRPIDELFRAGMAAMDRAEAEGPEPRLRDSVHYRNGLMIALLAGTLLRVKNFAALELGRTLIRQSDSYLLVVPASEVKNRQEIEQPIIGWLTPYLDRYFAHHHPRLLQGGESKHLWINQYGGVMKPHAVGRTVTKVTGNLVGAPISAHLFRHCAATTIAIEDPETGKRLARPNPLAEWIVEAVPHLRIVEQDLWDAVRRRQAEILATPAVQKIKESKFWTRRRARHLLTGLVYCGVCGARFTSVGRDYLGCGGARNSGNCHNGRSIRRGQLESLILDALKSRLMQPDLVKEFVVEFHREINRLNRDSEQGRESRVKEMKAVSRKLGGLIEAIADGLRTPGLKGRLMELEQRKQTLEEELAHAPAPAPRLHQGLAEVYRRKVENLHEALAEPGTRDEALGLLRGLIERIELHPIDNGFEIELTGAIAHMVALSLDPTNSKQAAFDEKTACSVKVVAGTGFEPVTFRL